MPANDSLKQKETLWTKTKNEAMYQDESDWFAWCCFCCWCCSNEKGGMFQFDAPATDPAEKLPGIMISPGFSHVSIERD